MNRAKKGKLILPEAVFGSLREVQESTPQERVSKWKAWTLSKGGTVAEAGK